MSYCVKCGYELNDEINFCPKCGTKRYEENDSSEIASVQTDDNALEDTKDIKQKKKINLVLIVVAILLVIITLITIISNGLTDTNSEESKTQETTTIKSGEDYESFVFDAFWMGICGSFGVEYNDFKMAHTTYDYIQDFTTSDGYTAHYYLIQTAFETKNAFGQKVLHPVTARCYYVPDYSETVYATYVTLDGEVVVFDEEKESWLMDIGETKTTTKETTTKAPTTKAPTTKVPTTKPTTTKEVSHQDNQDVFDEINQGVWDDAEDYEENYQMAEQDFLEDIYEYEFEYEEEEKENDSFIVGQLPDELLEELENAS